MKCTSLLLFCWATLLAFPAEAQSQRQWSDPLVAQAVQGRDAASTTTAYQRLPTALHGQVRDAVWHLGTHAAGLYIDFKTTADHISVRYKVSGALNMPHMPTTGVSGLDLYGWDQEGQRWNWAYGKYQFKDTISYEFTAIGNDKDLQYRLYLPLYNAVTWLEIGVAEGEKVTYVQNTQKPIVIYGTSIAQGACASRPGLGWTNILGRSLPNPVVNLAFSGNGRLEQPILDHIVGMDAELVILDCIPNLSITKERSPAQLDSLLQHAVATVRQHQPQVPIILTAHSSGFNSDILNRTSNQEYEHSSTVAKSTFDKLVLQGVKNIYWLSNADIGLDTESTVDYAHPNDVGMQKIADAYLRLIGTIKR